MLRDTLASLVGDYRDIKQEVVWFFAASFVLFV